MDPEDRLYLTAKLAEYLPEWVTQIHIGDLNLLQWCVILMMVPVAYGLGSVGASILYRIGSRGAAFTKSQLDDRLLDAGRGPARLFLAMAALTALVQFVGLAAPVRQSVVRITTVVGIAAGGWLVIRLIRAVATSIEEKALSDGDELKARGVRTQVLVLRRVASIVVGVITAAILLLQFEVVRSIGVSLLASAGILGVVLGVAAQKSIGGLLAGIQLSITQPVRIGDTVIVEGEWGSIEEINLTYVVVKIWDQRRLVVPITRFLEQPFQNWTKMSRELLGTIYFHADYRLPIDAVREELDRILDGNPRWDGRNKSVLVTNATDRTMEVRALISAKDSSDQWDLRCEVREKLLAWLREFEGGRYLPRLRLEGNSGVEGDSAVKSAPANQGVG